MLEDKLWTRHSASHVQLFSMMTSLKEAVISHLIRYLTQAAATGCVFLALALLITDPFAAVARPHILILSLFTPNDPATLYLHRMIQQRNIGQALKCVAGTRKLHTRHVHVCIRDRNMPGAHISSSQEDNHCPPACQDFLLLLSWYMFL